MLVDDLVLQVQDMKRRKIMPPLLDAYTNITNEVTGCPRFVLDRRVMDLAWRCLSRFNADTMVKGLPLCRLPHNPMWVEASYADLTASATQFFPEATEQQLRDEAERAMPKRIGWILRQSADVIEFEETIMFESSAVSHVMLFEKLIWPITYLPWKMRFAPGESIPFLLEQDYSAHQRTLSEALSYFRLVKKLTNADIGSPEALRYLEQRTMVSWSSSSDGQRIGRLYDHYTSKPATRKPALGLLSSWSNNMSNDFAFLLTLLMLLNSRELTEIGPAPDNTRINNQRVKRGKPPLATVRPIQLHLRRRHLLQGQRKGLTRQQLESQLVMGHFKVRKTGIFWWSPHWRNLNEDQATPSPRTYHVHE